MIQERVLLTTMTIRQAKQQKHFQVKLPRDTRKVIGVELGLRWLAIPQNSPLIPPVAITRETFADKGLRFKRNLLIGELKLQSCETANLFYAGHLLIDNNSGFADFSENKKWIATNYTHQCKAYEESVAVDAASTILQGVYKDRYGEIKPEVNYVVSVYVWTEINNPLKESK